MPHKPKKPCAYPSCPNLTDGYYCDDHKSKGNFEYNHYRRDPNTNKRYGNKWREIRERYVKAHPLCEECLKEGWYVPVDVVHHKLPTRDGGGHNEGNLMSVCNHHHALLHAELDKRLNV
jgi:5-methylcytosine-specific restriction protein A